MLFMNNFFLGFVDDWDVLLVNVFLINHWLDMFVNHRSVMFMDHFSVLFVDNVLMMFVDDLSVGFLNNWLFNDSIDNRCLRVGEHLSCGCIGSKDGCFVVTDHNWSL